MTRHLIIVLFFITVGTFSYSIAEEIDYYFYVQLKDKNHSPYSPDNPSVFLSERAIQRRAYFNVPIDSTDLPINPDYQNQIKNLGITVHCTTKWLNGLTVRLNDSSRITQVKEFPFVKYVEYTGKNRRKTTSLYKVKANDTDYGKAGVQIDHLNGRILHQSGFMGEDIHIAVIDAGFNAVNTNPAFQTLRDEGRILGVKDFVNPESDIYKEHSHGAYVLSTMAAEKEGIFVGTAPNASYLLIRTEDDLPEFPYEPDFWISGIEYADSVGVDMATTSLGYTTFNDRSMNYLHEKLNGISTRASIAANIAYKKGILLFNAAGNEGDKFWKYISVPADADGVITVGSVSEDSIPSSFSSFGPSADGRVKPELCAIGQSSALVSSTGNPVWSNGTSFATPILAGLAACYLQASKALLPNFTLDTLRTNLFKTGHLYQNPTSQMGYGVPDFGKALNMLNKTNTDFPKHQKSQTAQKIYISGSKSLVIPVETNNDFEKAYLYSLSGILCGQFSIIEGEITINLTDYQAGLYILKLTEE